jgi:uncharacterized protein YbcI
MPSPEEEKAGGGSRAAAISNHVVRLMREYTGRGPTGARTHMSEDLVTVLVWDTLTKGERSLARDGESERVIDTRKAYQRTMREELTNGVAELTGRPVIAFMSDNHVDPDMGVEIFILGDHAADGTTAV